jgi:hypothetical protein
LKIDCGIGREQAEKIIAMLNRALASKDTKTINAKLDELMALAERPAGREVLNCAGSSNNCVQGTQNIDERRFGDPQPPPKIVGMFIRDPNDPTTIDPNPAANIMGPSLDRPGASITFTVDRVFPTPIFEVVCDRPCSATGMGIQGAFSPKFLSSQSPNITGVALGLMGPLFPNTPVTLKVYSADNQKIKILSVDAYIPPIQP